MTGKTRILGDLLREVRQRLKLSIPDMARKLAVNKNTLGDYEREERLPDLEFLGEFAKVTGWDVKKLIEARLAASTHSGLFQSTLRSISSATDAVVEFALRRSGLSPERLHHIQQTALSQGLDAAGVERIFGGQSHGELRVEEPRPGYAYIPLFDLAAKGGAGGRVVEQEVVIDALAFKEEWIRQELHVRPDDLRLIYVEGDSMEPDLRAGDIVLLDHTDTSARREGIYVLRMDGALLVKSLQRLPGGVVKVISRNTAYESFTIMAAELETGNGTAIIGRVVWACRRF